MIDLDALELAGISNAHRRAALISYLDELGFTAQDMVAAEQEGRLFGLAGDALARSGPPEHSLRTAADAIGLALDDVAHAWAVLGLTVASPDQIALSRADVDGLATWATMKTLMGDDAALGLLRVMGAAMARFAEAESSVVRVGLPDINITHTDDELATAQAWRAIAQFIPRIGAMLDAVHRHHLVSARTYFEGVMRDTSATVVCGIGFVDLSGFTALTQMLTPGELSGLLSAFSEAVDEVVHADGGRVVKFIGDAVMWVSPTPEMLARAATDLVNYPKAKAEGVQVRAGLAFGPILAIDGDYFGNAVNLAARLVGAAEPGQILAAPELHEELPDWPATALAPLALKGFDAPVTAYALDHQG